MLLLFRRLGFQGIFPAAPFFLLGGFIILLAARRSAGGAAAFAATAVFRFKRLEKTEGEGKGVGERQEGGRDRQIDSVVS